MSERDLVIRGVHFDYKLVRPSENNGEGYACVGMKDSRGEIYDARIKVYEEQGLSVIKTKLAKAVIFHEDCIARQKSWKLSQRVDNYSKSSRSSLTSALKKQQKAEKRLRE